MAQASPLTLHAAPAAGFDAPFEMLAACHERVRRMLVLLARLQAHLARAGTDTQAREAATDVMRYFDRAGPAHHEDEERHVLPLLAASADAGLRSLAARLQSEHAAMATHWAEVRQDLIAVQAGRPLPADAPARWAAYTTLYEAHLEAEDGIAYPATQPLLGAAALAHMGREMAVRRGLPG